MSSVVSDAVPVPAGVDLRLPPATDDAALCAELASCLARFVEGTADEPTMERARRALAGFDAATLVW